MSEATAAQVSTTPAGGTEAAEPVVVHGGDSPVSWNDLETLTESKPEKKSTESKKDRKSTRLNSSHT